MKILLFAILVLMLLAGCGGGGDDLTDSPTSSIQPVDCAKAPGTCQ